MREDIYIGLNLRGEGVVNLLAERSIRVKALIALQELDTRGQILTNSWITAIYINLVDILRGDKAPEQVGHQRTTSQQTQVLALDTLAIKPDWHKCYFFHPTALKDYNL